MCEVGVIHNYETLMLMKDNTIPIIKLSLLYFPFTSFTAFLRMGSKVNPFNTTLGSRYPAKWSAIFPGLRVQVSLTSQNRRITSFEDKQCPPQFSQKFVDTFGMSIYAG